MRRGFTLIELLVVIAIIAILAAILFPVFAKARAKARTATCVSNLKQYSLALIMYCDDHGGFGPWNSCGSFVPNKLDWGGYGPRFDSSIYSCAEGGALALHPRRGAQCRTSTCASAPYWNMDYIPCARVVHPESVMLVADASTGLAPKTEPTGPAAFYDVTGGGRMQPRHQSVNNMAFCDGHVKGMTPAWLLDDLTRGDADADNDGKADGEKTGQGNWYRMSR